MPIKKYTIAFAIQDAMAQAAIKRSVSGLESIEKAAKKAAAAMGHAYDQTAVAAQQSAVKQAQAVNGVATARERAETRATAASRKGQQQQIIGLQKVQMAGIKLGDRLAAEADLKAKQLDAIQSRMAAKDYRRQVTRQAQQERMNRKALTDEEVAQHVRNSIIDRANQKRVDAAMRAAGVEKRTLRDSIMDFARLGTAIGATRFTMQKLTELGQAYAQAMREAGEESRRMAAQFGEQRDELGELAAVLDKPNDKNFVLQFAKFNKTTGMKAGESKAFQTELANSGAQYVGKHISEDQFEVFKEKLAKFSVANHLEPSVAGNLGGMVLASEDFTKFGAKGADEALGRANSAFQILKRGKGANPVLLSQLVKSAGTLLREDREQGTMSSLSEVATGISVQAEQNPDEAEVFQRNAVQALRKFEDKKAGPLLAEANITAKDRPFEAAAKLRTAIAKQLKTAPAGTKELDVLNEHFDEREARGLSSMMNGVSGGIIKDREDYEKKMGGAANANKQIDAFQKTETFRKREGQADIALSEAARGAENSKLDILRDQSKAYMVRNKLIDTSSVKMKQWAMNKLTFGMLDYSDQALVDVYGARMLNARIPGTANDMPSLPNNPERREAMFNQYIGQAEQMGVDPIQPLVGELAETNKLLRDFLARPQNNARGGPAPRPGAPAVLPAAPPAGPLRP